MSHWWSSNRDKILFLNLLDVVKAKEECSKDGANTRMPDFMTNSSSDGVVAESGKGIQTIAQNIDSMRFFDPILGQ
jgi:hypothetical protein